MKTITQGLFPFGAACIAVTAFAQTSAREYSLEIERQPLAAALTEFSRQTGLQIGYFPEALTENILIGPLSGRYTADAAVTELLSPLGLAFEQLNARTIAITSPESTRSQRHGYLTTERTMDHRMAPSFMRLADLRLAATEEDDERIRTAENPREADNNKRERRTRALAIEEVVVTATKRTESVLDVPMSIAVIGNQDIERRGLIGMEDYLRSIPGVNQVETSAIDNAIIIRGITTTPSFENARGGPTVASYFDETPITGAGGGLGSGIDVRPVDIERIEVLRGPQGTTFGSASLGGAMRIIPAKPNLDEFTTKVGASYSETSGTGSDNTMIQGAVNIPVVPGKLALRAVGYRFDESGYYRNIAGINPATIAEAESYGLGDYVRGYVQDDVGRIRSTGGRFAALWQPTDKLNLSMNFLTQTIEQDGWPGATVAPYEQATIPVAEGARARGKASEVADTDIDLLNLVLNYDLGWAALTSAASWIESDSLWTQGYFPSSIDPSDFESFTVETRLASQLPGRFQFLSGVFYENVDEEFGEASHYNDGAEHPDGPNPVYTYEQERGLEQSAVFGELSYDLTPKLTATVGGRYFKYDKQDSVLEEGVWAGVPIGEGVAQRLDSSKSGSSFKAHLSYEPTEDSLLYVSWAEGFRLGRPAVGLPAGVCDTNGDGLLDGTNVSIESTKRIDPDFLESYELGGKFALFDRRMVVDAAIYHIDWDGLPTAVTAPTCSIEFQGYIANAGAMTSEGVELQASLSVMAGLKLDFGVGYTKAELTKDSGEEVGAPKGSRVPGTPEVSANFAAQYDFQVAGYNAFVRADSFYAGKFYSDFLQTRGLGDYIKVDARVGVVIRSVGVELFVRNLTDEDAFTTGFVTVEAPFFRGFNLRPRTIGIQLNYSFE